LRTFQAPPKQTFLVHGEPAASAELCQAITTNLSWDVRVAAYKQKVPVD